MWANILGLILLSGEFGGDLAVPNPDLHSANNGDEGMTACDPQNSWASSKHQSTEQNDLYWNLSSLVESL